MQGVSDDSKVWRKPVDISQPLVARITKSSLAIRTRFSSLKDPLERVDTRGLAPIEGTKASC